LGLAVQLGRRDAVELILAARESKYQELTYEVPLASKNGDLRMVKLLLQKLSWQSGHLPFDYESALRNPVKKGHAEIVNAFLDAIPSKSLRNASLASCFLVAARRKHWEIANSLVSHGK